MQDGTRFSYPGRMEGQEGMEGDRYLFQRVLDDLQALSSDTAATNCYFCLVSTSQVLNSW